MHPQELLNIQSSTQKIESIDWNFKVFDFGSVKFDYKNMNKQIETTHFEPILKITNYLAKKQGNQLIKRTQIHLYDKIVILEDILKNKVNQQQEIQIEELIQTQNIQNFDNKSSDFSNEKSQKSQSDYKIKDKPVKCKKNQRVTLMPKKNRRQIIDKDGQHIEWNRETKNIPRNILRVFIKRLEKQESQQNIILKEISQKIEYNNTFIQQVINHPILRKRFKQFLLKEANNWINTFRVRDKESHAEAVRIYLDRIRKMQISQKMNDQKKYQSSQELQY